MNFDSNTEDFIDAAQLLPYPLRPPTTTPQPPQSIALTEFHFILLYKDRIAGVCSLDEKLVYEESLPLVSRNHTVIKGIPGLDVHDQKANEEVLGFASDPVRKTYWVYTDQSLFELVIGNEDRDVWRIYLEKAQYDLAMKYAKVPSSYG